ncbi:translocation/assembly module TamB [Rouxiella badensis]|uniref:autotransporter assembly complex protein TamB n=1 Tax=Rouxiella badensis TaxID=1646377 RepID=UPI001D15D598|nr:translocation/assembly module TamB domain-containing protein [Rouxiella badensis]MCC3719537.1 translocation/assembly module TamB [Rouxiella badensis]MCC3728787.1 translocation/assembly module TamB [Rouxiella badensis]MCC3733212.1 translocation/assembly module TamB [Rouxiella badensis]MCC3741017.1 translocation/assembly module TamB [Rouxiella badensis]MCC3758137.1 translocation/assembly module TamB [Rouxiella badensis]
MSLFKKICLAFLIILLLLMGAVAFLVGTQTGLHLVLNGAQRFVPGLSIANVDGGWRSLTLKGVEYKMPGVDVKAGEFHLSVDLSCLRHSQLCINAVRAQDVSVVVKTNEMTPSTKTEPESSEPLTNLSTPYPIRLRLLTLNNVSVAIDDETVSLAEFRTGIEWKGRALTMLPTQINGLLVALPKTPQHPLPPVVQEATDKAVAKVSEKVTGKPAEAPKPATPEPPIGDTLKAIFDKPLLPNLPDFTLPLDLTIQQITGENLRLTGDTDLLVNRLLLKVTTENQRVRLDKLEVRSPQGSIDGIGQAELTDSWPVNMTVNTAVNIDPLKGEKVKLTVGGELRKQLKVGVNLSGPVRAQLALQTELAEVGLPLDLTLQSEALQWPLTGTPQYQIKGFNMKFSGKATDYALSLRSSFTGEQLPPASLTLDGTGNLEQFKLKLMRLAALQGNTDLSGVVDWSKAVSWNTQLTLSNIDTAKQWPEWPARLAGKIAMRGSLYGGTWQLQVPTLELDGNVKKNLVKARGNLRGNSYGQWDIPQLHLELGRNNLDVKGKLADKWALDANIDAPHLDGALPGLGGVVKGLVQVRGDLKAPQLLADLTASNVRWQAMSVNRVSIKGNVTSSDQIQGTLAVKVQQLKQDALDISDITLDAKGNEKQHQLNLNITGKPVGGHLAVNGSFDRKTQQWKGNISNTLFNTPVGDWRLTRPIALTYFNTEQRVTVGPHCWQNPNADVCVPTTLDAGTSGQASIVLNRFDLAMLKPFLTDDTQLAGQFSGKANVAWKAQGGLPQASVSLVGKGVKVQQLVQGNPLPVAFDTLNVNAGLQNGRANLDWMIKIANNGQLDGNLQIADPMGRRNLSGNVNLTRISMALLQPALMDGEKASGILNANLRVGGNAQKPQVYGKLALTNVDIDAQFMPFDITNANLNINFNGMSSLLDGVIQTPHGQLALNGNADWNDPNNWRARIAAKGDKVRVSVPPMVRLDVSPDLVFDATPQAFSLNGRVDIPWARITVQELPQSAVGVSSDEVMLNDQRQPIAPASTSIPINTNLVVNIGDDVRLDAFGLKARLKGALKVVQDKRGLGLNGQIDIPSGRFHAYGQDLIVRKGQLLFSGPADQPLLNIEAIRNPDSTENDVVAGVRVTGDADAPKLEVFSDPTMSQQEALSYLLRGQGLDSSGADSSAMTSMLIGMGVAQSGKLVGKIGEAFGVSNLSLDTQGVGDSSQVVVSGYVLPGLQVKYGVGIFDSLATLTLRYRLMPKLYLEAVSGIDQALDLLYQFEF